jgi:hypothetical protein
MHIHMHIHMHMHIIIIIIIILKFANDIIINLKPHCECIRCSHFNVDDVTSSVTVDSALEPS